MADIVVGLFLASTLHNRSEDCIRVLHKALPQVLVLALADEADRSQ